MMFSNRRFKVLATSSIGRSRLRTAHPCHQRKCLRAGRTALKQRRTLSQSSALSQYILSTIVRDPYDGTTTAGADNNPPMQFALPVEGWRAFFMEIISKDEVDVCSSVSIADCRRTAALVLDGEYKSNALLQVSTRKSTCGLVSLRRMRNPGARSRKVRIRHASLADYSCSVPRNLPLSGVRSGKNCLYDAHCERSCGRC